MRLLAGILSGQQFSSEITGDGSLRKRPMRRVLDPLARMGARITGTPEGTAPLRIEPVDRLYAITYEMPVASAQVKSAILLAGLYADGVTTVVENVPTRDHTECMLGLEVGREQEKREVQVQGGMKIEAKKYVVPGDISSAAFLLSAALLTPQSEVVIRNVGLNPTRTAVLDVFRQMGGSIELTNRREVAGETIGDVVARSSELSTGFELQGARIAALIDEIPILAVTATFAKGLFVVRDAQELRAKESDRIKAIVTNLRTLGVEVEEYDDGFAFEGAKDIRGAELESFGDHRIAMAFAVAGLQARGGVKIRGAECVEISFPGFWEMVQSLR
jgi:3-phosphoshikimate 1-carboxyvinyltransferase